jgi:uncharacterized membrane-anchored protein
MNNQQRGLTLLVAIGLQVAVLAGMLVNASLPLWSGEEIKLRTVPVDPRSLFRGNYARLNYEISSVPAGKLAGRSIRHGEVVYVSLTQAEDGVYEYADVSLEKPDHGTFIRGRYQHSNFGLAGQSDVEQLSIQYGLEAYFAPVEEALALERELRAGGAVATVMILGNGQSALKSISAD